MALDSAAATTDFKEDRYYTRIFLRRLILHPLILRKSDRVTLIYAQNFPPSSISHRELWL